jgi:ketopantoate reductase
MVAAASMACATRLCLHQILLDRGLAALFVELIREVAGIASRLGIPLDDFRGFVVKTLSTIPFEDAVESVIAGGRTMRDRGLTQVRISMLQDLERGKRTEADQTLGHIVRLAADLGVPVPKVELLYRILRGTEAAQRASAVPA